MTAALSRITKQYAALEVAVSRQMTAICKPFCSDCKKVCCSPEYCSETIVSPFLTHLISQARPTRAFCSQQGWLTSAGCALTVGRPPVCYQFSCNKIVNSLSDDHHRYHFQVLSELVAHIGKRALGSRHLVEIMNPDDLPKVRIKRFQRRLRDGWRAFDAIRSLSVAGCPPPSLTADLFKIVPVPVSLMKTPRKA